MEPDDLEAAAMALFKKRKSRATRRAEARALKAKAKMEAKLAAKLGQIQVRDDVQTREARPDMPRARACDHIESVDAAEIREQARARLDRNGIQARHALKLLKRNRVKQSFDD